ncbi:MAG: TraX family protein [Alphaproteobacteria bacterium]
MSWKAGMQKLKILKSYGDALTAHDVLKAFALLTMIADHAGYFFFPEHEWLRVIGRLSAPVWFYLVGYTGARPVPQSWLIGGGIASACAIAIGGYVMPFNILFTLAAARVAMPYLERVAFSGRAAFVIVFITLAALSIPTAYILEYGTIGLLWALYGAQRRREPGEGQPGVQAVLLAAMIVASYLFQALTLPVMAGDHYLALAAALVVLFIVLQGFGPARWSVIPVYARPLQLLGRWTLEIYVLHLVAFRILAFFLYPGKYAFLQPEIFLQ